MMAGMTPELWSKVEANIFPFARPSVLPWEQFRWHQNYDAWKPHSSQALAIDLFGTLKAMSQSDRDPILDALARDIGVPEGGPWAVELEWEDRYNRLLETKKWTQVDAIACSPHSLILFEGKFTEKNGGACSQVSRTKTGAIQCNGNYVSQRNTVTGRAAKCALSGKGIRYWELIPSVLGFDASGDYSPCPFAGPWYQWMRNLVLASALNGDNRKASFVVAYADSPHLDFPKHLASADWEQFLRAVRSNTVQVATRSYQSILNIAHEAVTGCDSPILTDLEAWIEAKIQRATIGAAP